MRLRFVGLLMFVAAMIVGAACGLGGGDDPGDDPGGGGDLPGFGASPQLLRDPDHQYRVVNLHSFNGQPGGAVDIYPAVSSDLTALGAGAEPIVSGLAYGQATEPLQPGGVKSAFGNTSYGLGVLPHTPTDPASANLEIDITDSQSGKPWRRAVVVLGGTGNGLQSQTFYDTTGPDEPNAVPAAQPGKLSVMVDAQHAGDPNGPNPVTGFWLVGTGAGCLKATNDGTAQPATAINVQRSSFVVIDPGTSTLGFWHTTSPTYSSSTCGGSPAFSVTMPPLAAGTRAALFVYGPDGDHLAGVVVPFDS